MYYSEKEARELVIEAGHRLVENKLIARTWGNISARISEGQYVITPSGRAYDDLTPDDLVIVNIADCSYEGDIKPSSEKKIHSAAYKNRNNCEFIIHTHQFYASTLAANGEDMDFAPCAKYGLPGTDKLRNNVDRCIKEHPGCKTFLLEKHGTLLLGNCYEEAFELAEKLEQRSEEQFKRRVPSMDVQNYADFDTGRINIKGMSCVVLRQDPFVMECCYAGQTVKSYVDDFAQMVGPDVACVDNNIIAIRFGLFNRSAVLVKSVGAICIGKDADDAEAVAMIMSKNCACACYARNTRPLGVVDSNTQRVVYLKKYSKLK